MVDGAMASAPRRRGTHGFIMVVTNIGRNKMIYLNEDDIESLNNNMTVDSKKNFLLSLAKASNYTCSVCVMGRVCGRICSHTFCADDPSDYKIHKLFEEMIDE